MASTKKAETAKEAPAGLCGLLIRLEPGKIDEAAIKKHFGNRSVKTLAEVSREFGQSANTIKQSWRPEGMPGTNGKYVIAAILIWRLKYLAELAERQPGSTAKSQAVEIKDLEIRERILDLKAKERRDLLAEGNMIDAQKARAELSALIAVMRQRFGRIPADVEPMLPADIAVAMRVELERAIGRVCTWFAEASVQSLQNELRRMEGAE
jgi:hypothetical protein